MTPGAEDDGTGLEGRGLRAATGPRRVLIANESRERAEAFGRAVVGLGHEAHACEDPAAAPGAAERLQPDVVLVGRPGPPDEALALIARLVSPGLWPVIALLAELDASYVEEAARVGAFGYLLGTRADELQAALAIALARFDQYRKLQDAFARRAVIEQAKGILMARSGIGPGAAFDLLRAHARGNSRRVVDVAEAVVESHSLLVPIADESEGSQPLAG